MRAYTLVSYAIDGETWLHDLGGIDDYYLSDMHFERLDGGYTTDCRLGIQFFTWYIVKLDFNVTLCSTCNILIVANGISYPEMNMISWSWGVGDVTKTSEFSYNV